MSAVRKVELAALREARTKLGNFIAATNGDSSHCVVFEQRPGSRCEPFTDEQRRAIRLYVESWIVEPFDAALAGIDGDRSWQNESTLDAVTRYAA